MTVQPFPMRRPATHPSVASSQRWDTHSSTGSKHFWQANGGLAAFGYPITEEFAQVSPTDGQTYTVQYFERARFEYHAEHQGTPHEVQLGLLGRRVPVARGWLSEA